MKHLLLAALLVLVSGVSAEAGHIWPSSYPDPVATALSKLRSHTGVNIPHVVVPKLSYSASKSSFTWSHDWSSDSSTTVDCPDPSDSTNHTHSWPSGNIPSPWTWGSGYPGWGFSDEKIEQRFEDKFDELSSELDDLIANVPDYADSSDYQELVDDIQKLMDRHSNFIDRVDAKIEHITSAIDRTDNTISHLNDVLDRLENNSHIPAKALAQIESQIEKAKSRFEDRVTSLEAKKTALQDKLEQYGMFQSDVEDYLQNVQNSTTTPITSTTLASESVVNSLAVSLNQVAAQASQALTETTQQSNSSSTTNAFQSAAAGTTSTTDSSTQSTSSDSSQPVSSSTGSSLSALQSPTLTSVTPISEKAEVQFAAGTNLSQTVSGGATEVGGVDVTFESQAGGTFSSDYFQVSNDQSLLQSIGQTAFDKINFLLSDDLQGWELHFDGSFDGSASIVLGYDDSILPAGIDESHLQIMHFNSVTGVWEVPEGFTVDTIANQFRFSVDSFSPFVLTFNANSSANPEPSTGVIFATGLLMLAGRRRRKAC